MLSLADVIKPAVRPDAAPDYSYVDEIDVFVHDAHATTVKEIRVELADPTYQQWRHARCATNNRGCSGPMCRWARRNWRNENVATRAALKGKPRTPQPLLENMIAEELYKLFDDHLEKLWQAHLAKKKLERDIQKALSKNSQSGQPNTPVNPEPLGNLQIAESRGPAGLLFAELI